MESKRRNVAVSLASLTAFNFREIQTWAVESACQVNRPTRRVHHHIYKRSKAFTTATAAASPKRRSTENVESSPPPRKKLCPKSSGRKAEKQPIAYSRHRFHTINSNWYFLFLFSRDTNSREPLLAWVSIMRRKSTSEKSEEIFFAPKRKPGPR